MPAYREHEDDAIIPHAMVLIDAMRDIHALDWTPD